MLTCARLGLAPDPPPLRPGRRFSGLAGTRTALGLVEAVQVDPLNVVARSHDLALFGRVRDHRPEYLGSLLYRERAFFEAAHSAPYRTGSGAELRSRGPLAARDLPGVGRAGSFRSAKETSVALYYLWLTGELMTHGRRGFERVYAFRSDVAPAEYDYAAPYAEAEAFFARKACRWAGLFTAQTWAARFFRHVGRKER